MTISIVHGTAAYLRVAFKDKDGAPSIPLSVEYTVVAPKTGETLLAWAAATPPAASMTLAIGSSVNSIASLPLATKLKAGELRELRRVVVRAVFDTNNEIQGYQDYYITAVSGNKAVP